MTVLGIVGRRQNKTKKKVLKGIYNIARTITYGHKYNTRKTMNTFMFKGYSLLKSYLKYGQYIISRADLLMQQSVIHSIFFYGLATKLGKGYNTE